MKIKEILSEYRNDFSAVLVCEHCGSTQRINSGYHDNNYHTRVIPGMFCRACRLNRAGEELPAPTKGPTP